MQLILVILIFNTIIWKKCVKVKKIPNINTKEAFMKIYDFEGKKNICAERVRIARKSLGLSQEELAARLQIKGVNIERDSISRIEIGTRFVADFELKILSEILGVSVNYLLGIE